LRFVDGWRSYIEAIVAQKAQCKGKAEVVPKWLPPSRGFLKENVDASNGRDGMKGVGVIVRNKKGQIMVAARKRFRADWEVDTMEAFVVVSGLKVCWEAGFRRVKLEMDSKIVAEELNGRRNLHNHTSVFIHDALTLESLFLQFHSRMCGEVQIW